MTAAVTVAGLLILAGLWLVVSFLRDETPAGTPETPYVPAESRPAPLGAVSREWVAPEQAMPERDPNYGLSPDVVAAGRAHLQGRAVTRSKVTPVTADEEAAYQGWLKEIGHG